MSAIAGFWSFGGTSSPSENCSRMLTALAPYGIAGSGQFDDDNLSLGYRQSLLLPEDRFDAQPLSGGHVSAFIADVRLDNRRDLIRELNIPDAANVADSGILLAAWQAWGESCVERLLGAFAFAVWNRRDQSLFLVRDQTGERPLFYTARENCFAFASMPKGLHPVVGAEIDEDYIASSLALAFVPVEQTIFRGIVRLPAGCALSAREGKLRIWQYWHPERLPELRLRSDEEYLEAFLERFDAAVLPRLRTTGKIGTQLSAGLDSSAVTAAAARLLGLEGRSLSAYTAIPRSDFHGRTIDLDDEGPAASEVASMYPNLRHVLVNSERGDFFDAIDLSSSLYDHPAYSPTNEIWSHAILEQAKESGVTVLLNGSCGNATISSYGMGAFSQWFRTGRWGTLLRVAQEVRGTGEASGKSILRHALWPSLPLWLRKATDPHMRHFSLDFCVLRPEVIQRLDLYRKSLRDGYTDEPGGRPLLSTLLKYGDISEGCVAAQAGWQMDFRDPTYDSRVIEFCMTVPLEQFLRGGRLRSLVRRAMADRLPHSTVARTQRGRQSADWNLTMGEMRDRMRSEVALLEASPLASRILDLGRMRSLIETWPTAGFERNDVRAPYHMALSRGFAHGRFLRKYDPSLST